MRDRLYKSLPKGTRSVLTPAAQLWNQWLGIMAADGIHREENTMPTGDTARLLLLLLSI